jgi:uncharacterized repeat protein (TIGR03803 family)
MMAASSPAQTVTTPYSFDGADGQWPFYGVSTQGRDGALYGTTEEGGKYNLGTIFKRTIGTGQIALHSFSGPEGSYPEGGLTLGSDGNFYGTAAAGGANGFGVLFRITPAGVLTVLYSFTGTTDGAYPAAAPIQASDGNFYGTTYGLTVEPYLPTVYKFTTSSGTLSTIWMFPYLYESPQAPLAQAPDGYLYTTSYSGGHLNYGTIRKLSTSGVLISTHNFNGATEGRNPIAPLIVGSDGYLYGTNQHGGIYGNGTVFRFDGGKGVVTVLHSFGATATDGQYSNAGLTEGTDGFYYGGTVLGGTSGAGTLYRFTTAGETYSQLYSFQPNLNSPDAGLSAAPAQHTSGIFYGTTTFGGDNGLGSVYTLDMGLGPFVSLVLPVGKVGGTAQILGQGLTGTTSVTFNGVAASRFAVVNDTYMTAVVPSAATSGKVVVTTPSGALTSNVNFRIIQ